jgi:hypothetical protein
MTDFYVVCIKISWLGPASDILDFQVWQPSRKMLQQGGSTGQVPGERSQSTAVFL